MEEVVEERGGRKDKIEEDEEEEAIDMEEEAIDMHAGVYIY